MPSNPMKKPKLQFIGFTYFRLTL